MGYTTTDRIFRSLVQNNKTAVENGINVPHGQIGAGLYTSAAPTLANNDFGFFRMTSDGKLMVDTELEVSSLTVTNVAVFSTDNTAANMAYAKVNANQIPYSLITNTDATASAVPVAGNTVGVADVALPVADANVLAAVGVTNDAIKTLGTDTYTEASSKCIVVGGVRNDGGASLVDTDQEFAPFQFNAYGMLNTNFDMIRDVAPDVNTGALSAGTQRMTLATDDPAVSSLALIDDTVATLGTSTYVEATTKALTIGALRRDADTSAVDTDNEISPLTMDDKGQLKVNVKSIVGVIPDEVPFGIGASSVFPAAGFYKASEDSVDDGEVGALHMTANRHLKVQDDAYDSSTQANKVAEVNPLNMQYVGETLLDLTNIAQTTTAYAYLDMAGYRYFSLQGETSGATPTDVLTVTVEATNQDDGTAAASCTYQDVTTSLFGVASWVDTDFFGIVDTAGAFKYVRVKYNTSTGGGNDADLTVYAKRMY
jgi:hypothetical protein